MTILRSEGAGDPDLGFYNGAVSNSLRLNGTSSTLTRTLVNSTDGSRQKNVWSFWTKFNVGGSSPNPYFYSKGEGGGVADIIYITITSNQRLYFIGYVGDSVTHELTTERQFRDPSAWYHIALAVDTTQTTDTNKVCLYVNGEKQTFGTNPSGSSANYPGTNALLAMNWYQTGNAGSTVEMISDYRASPHEDYRIDGYLAEFHSVDGLSFFSDTSGTANTSFNINSFGETKNGVWIPKSYTGSHGTQGYHLKFDNTSVGTGASDTVGADSAGSNHFTSAGIDSYDCNVPDCPENNFPVMNNLVKTTGTGVSTFSEGNLYIAKTGTTYSYFQSTFGVKTGKWYAECRLDSTINTFMVGITEQNMETYRTGENIDPHLTAGTAWYGDSGYGYFDGSSIAAGTFSSSTAIADGDVVGLALDLDSSTKTIKWYKNGSLAASKNLTANFVDHIVFALNLYNTNTAIWNFGQDSTFSGNESVGSNTDANGIGKFHESVPSGYLALCSSNLTDDDYASIGPNADNQASDFFATTFYAGTDDATRTFDLGFVCDWAWFKGDADSIGHQLYDSSRGATKYFASNTNANEQTNSEGVTDFDDSGNLLKIGNSNFLNKSGRNYSLWTWRINGGTTATNSDGSADSTVQVNTTVGMSQVLYTGNSSGSGDDQTIGHGLGVIPEVIMFKGRSFANYQDWYIHHKGLGDGVTTHIELNVADAEHADADYMNAVTPTASVFSLGYNFTTNKNAETYIAYCFNNVEGYSKFGKFTGNGDADGAFVYTGFRPAWVMIKNSDQSGSWMMMDIARSPINIGATANAFVADDSHSQTTVSTRGMDFLSNGFKIRTAAADMNNTGQDLIYFAFAEDPFKYANAK